MQLWMWSEFGYAPPRSASMTTTPRWGKNRRREWMEEMHIRWWYTSYRAINYANNWSVSRRRRSENRRRRSVLGIEVLHRKKIRVNTTETAFARGRPCGQSSGSYLTFFKASKRRGAKVKSEGKVHAMLKMQFHCNFKWGARKRISVLVLLAVVSISSGWWNFVLIFCVLSSSLLTGRLPESAGAERKWKWSKA